MEPTQTQTPLTRALETIRSLRAELDASRAAEEVAVIGVGVRLPGGIVDMSSYWRALVAGRDLTQPLPDDRKGPFASAWQGLPQRGGYFDDVFAFDAAFFGLSHRQAVALDPQHRLLLEVTWEALEDAALPPESLGEETPTGVYVGIANQEYREWNEEEEHDAYWAIGSGHSLAAGRLAYTFGLTGPAIAVDTACSSSLVAIHLARKALQAGECELAIAGGVNLVLSPSISRLLRPTHSLSRDGTCKPFDARANGFARAEGCAIVVLKRLADALADGDRVRAVIRGSALNQDGRSSGLTAPNVRAQARVIKAALADAGMEPDEIGAIEAHGTGTSLGDPIEIEAIEAALADRDPGADLYVGTAKANVGHTEAAAGVVGLVKAILTIERRQIPPLVHFSTLNPRINLDGVPIRIPKQAVDWRVDRARRNVGVSSFGMSGTNAHLIAGQPPDVAAAAGPTAVSGFEISAKTPTALREMAVRLAARLSELGPDDYPGFAYTATLGRARLPCRAAIAAADRAQALTALAEVAGGERSPDPVPRGAQATRADFGDHLPRRIIDLPTYPWERHRHAPRW